MGIEWRYQGFVERRGNEVDWRGDSRVRQKEEVNGEGWREITRVKGGRRWMEGAGQ